MLKQTRISIFIRQQKCYYSTTTPLKITPQRLGVEYEKHIVQTLNHKYKWSVAQSSKKSHDQGVDFHGSILVSKVHNRAVPVLGQCKHESKPIGVNYIRELQGTLSQFNNRVTEVSLDNFQPYVGLFMSSSGYTPFAERLAQQCSDGIVLCVTSDDAKSILQFTMNRAAREMFGSQFVAGFKRSSEQQQEITFFEQVTNGDPILLMNEDMN
jgi:hypothetical protein